MTLTIAMPQIDIKPDFESAVKKITKIFNDYGLTYQEAINVCTRARQNQKLVRPKMERTPPPILTDEEMVKYIRAAYRNSGIDGLIVRTLFATGARVDEFVNIKDEDFFFEQNRIRIVQGKNNNTRMVDIPERLSQDLKLYQELKRKKYPRRRFKAMFESNRRKPFNTRTIQRKVKSIGKVADIRQDLMLTPHALRYMCAYFLASMGLPLKAIKQQLGHKFEATTEYYLRFHLCEYGEAYQAAFRKSAIEGDSLFQKVEKLTNAPG